MRGAAGGGRPPFLSIAPRSVAPLVLTCEHAANRLPFSAGIGREQRRLLASHWGWDIGAWALTRDLARRLKAGAIAGRWSRLLIDLNRRVDDPTLIRSRAGKVPLPWNEDVTAEQTERRILAYHTPYHVEVDRLILRRLVRGVRPLLLAVHSFTPWFDGRPRPYEIGVLYEQHRRLAHRLGRFLRDAGLSVRYNRPYSGMAGMMYAVDRHGSHYRLPCLELEVNHDILVRQAQVTRLGAVVARGLGQLLREASPGAKS
jgi:predicted N-formylglutamate amidohydrolase